MGRTFGNITFADDYVADCTLKQFKAQYGGKVVGYDLELIYNELPKPKRKRRTKKGDE